MGRDELRVRLRRAGIDTRPFFHPIHTLPMYRSDRPHPVAEDLSRRGLNLPSCPTLTAGQIDHVCDAIIECGAPATRLASGL
jgi:perosamine synthetase